MAVVPSVLAQDGGTLCSNTCATKGNGVCDDGGEGSSFGTCDLGTDCEDCGAREGDVGACEDDSSWTDVELGTGEHTCKDFAHQRFWCTDFGAYSDAAKLACPVSCGLCTRSLSGCECAGVNNHMGVGEECSDERLYNGLQWCYVDRATCPNALISELDAINEQNLGFVYCGDIDISDEQCNEECVFSDDGRCDDGGMGSESAACPLGSDCKDCGPRLPNPDGVAVSLTKSHYASLGDCAKQVGAVGAEGMSSTFPATPEADDVCVATGDASSELVSCDALGVVTKKPYKKGNACGANGGIAQGEKKWTFWLQGGCSESEFNGVPTYARVDWEGPCVTETPVTGCYAEEGSMKIKKEVKSEKFSSFEDDCACSEHCKGLEDSNGAQLYAYFQWTEESQVCQCFNGKLKKYKQKAGVFSGPF